METQMSAKKTDLTPWKTLMIGNEPKERLIASLSQHSTTRAKDAMSNPAFVVSPNRQSAHVVAVTLSDLGFTSSPRTDQFMTEEFCTRWSSQHLASNVLRLCSPEDSPQLLLQGDDYPNGKRFWAAMPRLNTHGHKPSIFSIWGLGGYVSLDAHPVKPNTCWHLDAKLLFRLEEVVGSADPLESH